MSKVCGDIVDTHLAGDKIDPTTGIIRSVDDNVHMPKDKKMAKQVLLLLLFSLL